MASSGKVYLVGAGPGDPGLITVRGKDCLSRADVIVYDYLASNDLLVCARPTTEVIYVGKQAGEHTMSQDQINVLLVAKAKEGKMVVRLKGGDPFVFGRGGEEAQALHAAGISFEVVPGITAGVAAPAYAGIPVTHRGCNSVLTLVTGHEDPTKEQSDINWNALAASGTLVFYMGVKNLPQITRKLIDAGRPGDTPAALVRWGTLPVQTVVDGTLATIVDRVQKANLTPPCIIVVGEVVRLRQELNWFERRPLFGKTIVITRSKDQSSELAERLTDLGAHVLPFHTIRFAPPDNLDPLRPCVNRLDEYDWIIFTSVNGVSRFFDMLDSQGRDTRSLAGCKVCSIGPGTSASLLSRGIHPDLVPAKFTSAAIFDALSQEENLQGKRFLLPRADIAGKELPTKLTSAGAHATDIEAYRTLPGELTSEVRQALADRKVDVITFTSSSTVRNFASIVRAELGCLPETVAYVSIGPETTKAAREEGITIASEATEHTINGLVAALLGRFGAGSS